jgi:hypothetical protein
MDIVDRYVSSRDDGYRNPVVYRSWLHRLDIVVPICVPPYASSSRTNVSDAYSLPLEILAYLELPGVPVSRVLIHFSYFRIDKVQSPSRFGISAFQFLMTWDIFCCCFVHTIWNGDMNCVISSPVLRTQFVIHQSARPKLAAH